MGAEDRGYRNSYSADRLESEAGRAALEIGGKLPPPRGKTGVVLSPLQKLYQGWGGLRGGSGGEGQPEAPTTPSVIERIRETYGGLENQLNQLRANEQQRIGQSTASTIRALESMDPLAGYRQTVPLLASPQAAASTYLSAIGASPSQVQAQQALANQMMASQSADQSAFQQAMDQYAQQYRQAQQAEAYRNQAQAEAALGYATQAQQVGLTMARMQQEEAIRKMLLEAQLQLALQQGQGGGGRNQLQALQGLLGNVMF